MRQFLLGLSVSFVFILGCLVGAAAPSTSIGPASAEPPGRMPGAEAFEYECITEGPFDDAPEAKMNALGRRGWELVAATGEGRSSWCLKRRLP